MNLKTEELGIYQNKSLCVLLPGTPAWVYLGSASLQICPWTRSGWQACWGSRAGWWCTSAWPCCWLLWWRRWCCWTGWSTCRRTVSWSVRWKLPLCVVGMDFNELWPPCRCGQSAGGPVRPKLFPQKLCAGGFEASRRRTESHLSVEIKEDLTWNAPVWRYYWF